ncbi:MAG: hypothetical protein VCC01_00895 [Candidatus Hydrogenedentota bacterium]
MLSRFMTRREQLVLLFVGCAVIAHRTKQPFRKVEDIVNVRGIAEKRFEGMRDQISVQ